MPPPKPVNPEMTCPCGNTEKDPANQLHVPRLLKNCCLPFIQGKLNPPTAELLMRSRYTAHVLLYIDYLWATWSAEQRVRSSKQEIMDWASSCEWCGLQIIGTETGLETDSEGFVSFIAIFRQHGALQHHHETSLFRKVLGKWVYVDHRN